MKVEPAAPARSLTIRDNPSKSVGLDASARRLSDQLTPAESTWVPLVGHIRRPYGLMPPRAAQGIGLSQVRSISGRSVRWPPSSEQQLPCSFLSCACAKDRSRAMSSLLGPHTGFDSRESPSRSRQVRRRAPRVLLPIARRYRRGRRPQSNDFCAQLPKSSAFETSADAEPEPAVKKVCLTRSASSFARLATMPVNIAESEIVRSELGSLVAERDRSRKKSPITGERRRFARVRVSCSH